MGKNGYTSYGTECKLYPTRVPGSRPLYRYFDGRNHFYTQNAEEIGTIVPGVIGKSKYKSEGIAGYCFPEEHKGTVPFYRYYRYSGQADHYYTVDVADIGTIIPGTTGHHGYKYEGIACWVVPAQSKSGIYRNVKLSGAEINNQKWNEYAVAYLLQRGVFSNLSEDSINRHLLSEGEFC